MGRRWLSSQLANWRAIRTCGRKGKDRAGGQGRADLRVNIWQRSHEEALAITGRIRELLKDDAFVKRHRQQVSH
jgi:hypothetical protein